MSKPEIRIWILLSVVLVLFLICFSVEADLVEPPPDAMVLFRRDDDAAELFKKMFSTPGNIELRRSLARVYSESGYKIPARFMNLSADYIQSRRIDFTELNKITSERTGQPGLHANFLYAG